MRSASRSNRSSARACSPTPCVRRRAFDDEVRRTAYWVALLRYVGCTGHAHEISTVFGDDIALLAETLVFDAR